MDYLNRGYSPGYLGPSSYYSSGIPSGAPGSSGWKRNLLIVMVLASLVAIGYYVYILLKSTDIIHTTSEVDTTPKAAASSGLTEGGGLGTNTASAAASALHEVFYVAGNEYTYDDAAAVCAVYDAEVATYDQIAEAFAKGAEWCGYGWSQGGMALYPTQEASWSRRQQEVDQDKRTKCGRPGINGGYFDPSTRFGVNCFGVKPNCNNKKYPIPLEGVTGPDTEKVNKYKQDSGRIKVDPFNRNTWSMWGAIA